MQPDILANVSAFVLSCMVEGYSEQTITNYKKRLGQFLKFCKEAGVTYPGEITATHIRMFLLSKQQKGCRPQTIFNFHRELRAWFNWMVAEKVLKETPITANLKPPKVEKTLIVPLSPDQIKLMLTVCDDSFCGIRDKALILSFIDSGLRLSEMVSVNFEDIDFQRGVIKVMGKGAKERVVHLGKTALKAMVRYVLVRGQQSGPLWLSDERTPLTNVGIEKMVARVGKRAGITGVRCSPHTLRHTFGTLALTYGGTERQVQELMGHATQAMTKRYTATLQSKWAAEAHKKFSPVDNLRL